MTYGMCPFKIESNQPMSIKGHYDCLCIQDHVRHVPRLSRSSVIVVARVQTREDVVLKNGHVANHVGGCFLVDITTAKFLVILV